MYICSNSQLLVILEIHQTSTKSHATLTISEVVSGLDIFELELLRNKHCFNSNKFAFIFMLSLIIIVLLSLILNVPNISMRIEAVESRFENSKVLMEIIINWEFIMIACV